jgi:hypothetical protein
MRQHRFRGQSTVEYVVVCAALALALFVPLPGSGDGGPARSAVQILLDGFQKTYQRFTHSISLPS